MQKNAGNSLAASRRYWIKLFLFFTFSRTVFQSLIYPFPTLSVSILSRLILNRQVTTTHFLFFNGDQDTYR